MSDAPNIGEGSWDEGMRAAFRQAARESGSSVLARLEATQGKAPRVVLRDVPGEHTPVLKPATGEGKRISDRYQIVGEIARGGVGVILKGRDVDLGRDVAMKVLLEQHAGNPDLVQRFVEEAQVGGQLQHPGIVPVYEIGLHDDSRPYFAMKLVKGETLSALLSARAEPAEKRRRILRIYEQVCQTVAYAHARGVIHRDLKPSNVMVGPFGEVQVVDWGFAKILSHGGIADEERALVQRTVVQTVRSRGTGSAPSITGSVMGTPAYMPPEQALGEVEKLDERSDVFALGAILCEILTGEPPYTGDKSRLLMMAAECDLEPVYGRLDRCGADADLVKLCKRCLRPAQSSRPRNAGVVAQAVADHLASLEERARAAELEAAEARVRAQGERRARRLTLGLAAAILVAVVAGGGGLYFVDRQKREQARLLDQEKREQVAVIRTNVERVLDEAKIVWAEANAAEPEDLSPWPAAIEQAQKVVALARESGADAGTAKRVDEFAARVREDEGKARARAVQARRDREMVERLTAIGVQAGDDFKDAARDKSYAAAFREYGIDADGAPPDEIARRVRATGIAPELAFALEDWAYARRDSRFDDPHAWRALAEAARLLDKDPWRTKVRRLAEDGEMGKLQGLAKGTDLDALEPASAALFGLALLRISGPVDAVPVLRAAQQKEPYSFWPNFHLAWATYRLPEPNLDDAIACFKRALEQRDEFGVRYHLAAALRMRGDLDNAVTAWREIHNRDPEFGRVGQRLADTLVEKAKTYREGRFFDSAERAAREALALGPDHVMGLRELAGSLIEPHESTRRTSIEHKDEIAEAIAALRRATELEPETIQIRVELANALFYQWNFEQATATWREIMGKDERYVAYGHNRIAAALRFQGALDEAIEEYQTAARLRTNEAVLAETYAGLGKTFRAAQRFDDALETAERLKELSLAGGWNATGQVHFHRREYREAAEAFRKAAAASPRGSVFRGNLALNLALAGDLDGARVAWNQMREMIDEEEAEARKAGKRLPPTHRSADELLDMHVQAFVQAMKWEAALAATRLRIRIGADPDEPDPERLIDLGWFLGRTGRLDDAMDALRDAVDRRPDYWRAHLAIANALERGGSIDEYLDEFANAVKYNGDEMRPHMLHGHALVAVRDYDGAAKAYRNAAAADPKAGVPYYMLAFVAGKRDDTDARIAALRAFVQRAPPDVDRGYHLLANALREAGDLDGARAALAKALEAKPFNTGYLGAKALIRVARGDVDGGIDFLEENWLVWPRGWGAGRVQWAWQALDAGYAEAALRLCERWLAVHPGSWHAHAWLAWTYLYALDDKVRDADKALAHARKAVELAPDLPDAWFVLGAALCRQGRWKEALEAFGKARAASPWVEWKLGAYWRALAHWNLGNRGEALRQMAEGNAYYDALDDRAKWFTKLREEVEAVIK